jgi:DNA-binding SARP family transcriptional activator/WD40 repeat protein
MWFGVLGRVEARDQDGHRIPVGGTVRRQLLAALLCRAGESVPASTLVDDLWGATPPRTAAKTLQSHVVRLRDDLGRDAGSVIVTEGAGYRIELGPEQFDAAQFEAALDAGAAAARRGDDAACVELLTAGLADWRGEAYLDLADAPFVMTERMRLADLRATALEMRTDAELRLGVAASLVAELEGRIRREPYRERSWEQLILALYRAGRQADALAAYRMARERLAGDLGVDPGPALQSLEERILRQDPTLLVETRRADADSGKVAARRAATACPYRGLSGYDSGDAAVFVGRERLVSTIVGRLVDAPVVVVTGSSGSGKSSLVRAGVFPALRSGALPSSAAWRIDIREPMAPGATKGVDLLIVDQAEQLFTVLDNDARAARLRQLEDAVARGTRLLLVIRGDLFADLAEVAWLAGHAQRAPVLIGRVRDDDMARIIVEPARQFGIDVSTDVVDAILEQTTGQPQPLALISLALVRAWEHRVGATITLQSLEDGGGVAGAIETTAEAVYLQLASNEREAARHVLVRMATRTPTGWERRALVNPDSTDDATRAALCALVAGRLVTMTADRIELSHDALLERWPRLRQWLAERASGADLLEHVQSAAATWSAAGHADTDLYRGARLGAALEWRDSHPDDFSADERSFLDASTDSARAELDDARARADAMAQARRRAARVAVGLAVALVLAVVATALTIVARRQADRSASAERAAAVAALAGQLDAESLSSPDLATSALLAAAGYTLQDSSDSRGALLSVLQRGQSAAYRVGAPDRLLRLVGAADGSRLYALDNQALARVIDPRLRRVVKTFDPHADDLVGITRSNADLVVEGELSTARHTTGELSVLDAATGHPITVLDKAVSDGFVEPTMVTGGRWLAAVRSPDISEPGSTVAVFDTRDWGRPARAVHFSAPVLNIAAGRDVVAVATADRTIHLLDPRTMRIIASGRRPDLPGGPNSYGWPFALSPDGRRLAYATSSPIVVDTTRIAGTARKLPAQPQPVSVLRFSPDSTSLGVGSTSGSVAVYAATTGALASALTGQAGPVLGMLWTSTPRGPRLFTAGLDRQIVAWNVSGRNPLLHLDAPSVPSAVTAARFGNQVFGTWPSLQGYTPGTAAKLFDLNLLTHTVESWPAQLAKAELVSAVSTTPDDSRGIVSVQNALDRTSRWQLWDLRHRDLLARVPVPKIANQDHYLAAVIDAVGRHAVVSLGQGRLGLIALPSGHVLRTLHPTFTHATAPDLVVEPYAFAPDGRVVVTARDIGSSATGNRVGLLDVRTGRLEAQADLGPGELTAIAWSHDGSSVAIGTTSGQLVLYRADTLQFVRAAEDVQAGDVLSVSFSPDAQTLVTSGTDAAMNFWDVATMQREGPRIAAVGSGSAWWAWFAPDGEVTGLAPDGTTTADHERPFTFPGRVTTWLHLACTLAGSDITRGQWAHYIGPSPAYRRVCSA